MILSIVVSPYHPSDRRSMLHAVPTTEVDSPAPRPMNVATGHVHLTERVGAPPVPTVELCSILGWPPGRPVECSYCNGLP